MTKLAGNGEEPFQGPGCRKESSPVWEDQCNSQEWPLAMCIQFHCIETATYHGCKEDKVAEDVYIPILIIATNPFRCTGAENLCIMERRCGNFAPEYAGSPHGH